MFGTDNDTLRLVLLNGCMTGAGSVNSDFAALGLDLARFTPAVIAMRTAIKDDDAVRFATAFYRALSNRSDTIDVSLGYARKALLTSEGRLAFAIPALFSRAEPQVIWQEPPDTTPSGPNQEHQEEAPPTPRPKPSPPPPKPSTPLDQLVELMLRPPATSINENAGPAEGPSHVTVGAGEMEAGGDPFSLELWEDGAVGRVRELVAQGNVAGVREVLSERPERSATSLLVLFDAWIAWAAGEPERAARVLDAAASPELVIASDVARDRALIRAAVARELKQRTYADRLLAVIQDPVLWQHVEPKWLDHQAEDVHVETLAVVAARIHLTIDLQLERQLVKQLYRVEGGPSSKSEQPGPTRLAVNRLLPASDVVLPTLREYLMPTPAVDSRGEFVSIPPGSDPDHLTEFARSLDDARRRTLGGPEDDFLPVSEALDLENDDSVSVRSRDSELIRRLARLGQHRWRLMATTPFVEHATYLVAEANEPDDFFQKAAPLTRLEQAVIGSLGVSASGRNHVALEAPNGPPLLDLLYRVLPRLRAVRAFEVPSYGPDVPGARPKLLLRPTGEPPVGGTAIRDGSREAMDWVRDEYRTPMADFFGVSLCLSSPDPLVELVARVLGLPQAELT